MRHVCAVVSVAALVGLAMCGGGCSTPTPVIAAPSIITPNNVVYVGQTVPFAATGTGTIRWGGDAPGVATVDAATGRVTGIGIGRITIWAENEGGRTTRLLRVLPSFGGTWRGSYVVENCQASGTFSASAFCGTTIRVGDRLNMAIIFYQTEDRVTGGSFVLDSFPGGSLVGKLTDTSVGEDGQIRLAGSVEPIAGGPPGSMWKTCGWNLRIRALWWVNTSKCGSTSPAAAGCSQESTAWRASWAARRQESARPRNDRCHSSTWPGCCARRTTDAVRDRPAAARSRLHGIREDQAVQPIRRE
ncbi:MAG: hypothetical protein ACXWZR_13795 [Mycobacterium sp.]